MVGVVGYWDAQYNDGGPGHSKIFQKYWRFSAKAFGATHLVFIDEDGLKPSVGDLQIHFSRYDSLEEFLRVWNEKATMVFLETKDVVTGWEHHSLKDFEHPTGSPTFYVCGPNYERGLDVNWLSTNGFLEGNYLVTIESTREDVPLWSHVAASVALYDRISKENEWQSQ